MKYVIAIFVLLLVIFIMILSFNSVVVGLKDGNKFKAWWKRNVIDEDPEEKIK